MSGHLQGSFSLVFVSCENLIMTRVSIHEFSILCGTTLLVNLMGGAIWPIITDFISSKCTYSIHWEKEQQNRKYILLGQKGYTYAIMFTTATAVLALICTLFLENKFAVCVKAKKVNGKYSYDDDAI